MVCGREFSEDVLERIHDQVDCVVDLTRVGLSQEVCQGLDWRGADGRAKDRSCRVALLKLSRQGLIELPAAQAVSFVGPDVAAPSELAIETTLAQIRYPPVSAAGLRAAREAQLAIRVAAVSLAAPNRHTNQAAIPVRAVLAPEQDAPAGVKPLEWLLLTIVAVESVKQACAI